MFCGLFRKKIQKTIKEKKKEPVYVSWNELVVLQTFEAVIILKDGTTLSKIFSDYTYDNSWDLDLTRVFYRSMQSGKYSAMDFLHCLNNCTDFIILDGVSGGNSSYTETHVIKRSDVIGARIDRIHGEEKFDYTCHQMTQEQAERE